MDTVVWVPDPVVKVWGEPCVAAAEQGQGLFERSAGGDRLDDALDTVACFHGGVVERGGALSAPE